MLPGGGGGERKGAWGRGGGDGGGNCHEWVLTFGGRGHGMRPPPFDWGYRLFIW